MEHAILVHSPKYNNWVFDKSHPTQGRRFLNARNKLVLEAQSRRLNLYEIEPVPANIAELSLVHSEKYIHEVNDWGRCDEWVGDNPELGQLARLMAGGTVTALHELLNKKTLLAINFAGAKHHAMRDFSSGFCVYADFAIAAEMATELGERVAIFDFDAHHGDGTEMLLKKNKNVMTFSVHEYGIFPGTGLLSDYQNLALNFPLARHSDNEGLRLGVQTFLEACEHFNPTMIFIAAGADGLAADPLSHLNYTLGGYFETARAIREEFPTLPILLGGAGGYQPDDETPDAWVATALGLMATQTEVVKPDWV